MTLILESAARVFGKRGYADTSLRQLMAASRTSTTAFYARFAPMALEALGALESPGALGASAPREVAR